MTLDDLLRAIGPEVMFQCGLFRGRAGFLAGAATFDRDGLPRAHQLLKRHLGQLGLHEVDMEGAVVYPGVRNLRLSADFSTGAAGVLTAVRFGHGARQGWLPGVV